MTHESALALIRAGRAHKSPTSPMGFWEWTIQDEAGEWWSVSELDAAILAQVERGPS